MNAQSRIDVAVKRRIRAARLLQEGYKATEVAAMVQVPRQTVYRWQRVLAERGMDALRYLSKGGHPAVLGAEELVPLYVALLEGPLAHGFDTPLWTLKRVRLLIEREWGVHYSTVHVWRLLGKMGFSSQKPERRALERDEGAIQAWKQHTWPALKKSPARRTIDSGNR